MDPKADKQAESGQTAETRERREAIRKLGKYAAYAAPFTVLALAQKADAASGGRRPLHH